MLPENDKERKAIDLTAQWKLFPLATVALAKHIKFGADKYCDGEIRWDRTKSPDEVKSLMRHLFEHIQNDADPIAILWRACALCEKFLEGKMGTTEGYNPTGLPADLEEFLCSEGVLTEHQYEFPYTDTDFHLIMPPETWLNWTVRHLDPDRWYSIHQRWLAYLKEQEEV